MAQAVAKPRQRMTLRQRREARTFYLLISPFVFGFIALTLGPMLVSFYVSFTTWDLLTAPRWVGWDNYNRLFTADADFIQGIKVTLSYAAVALPLGLIVSFVLAMLMNRDIRGVSVFRAIYYMPSLLVGISVAALWIWVFDVDHGLLNQFLGVFGLPKVGWLTDPNWALRSLVLMSVWGVGNTMMIYLAGLKGIPQQLYEAASVDGAGWWPRFFNVTIPMLTPTIFYNLLMSLIGVFQYFDQSYIMTGGGPPVLQGDNIVGATKFYMLKLYDDAFGGNHLFGYAAAQACLLFIFILVLTIVVWNTQSRWVYYEGSSTAGR